MTTTLNARCSGAWLTADGTPVTIIERQGRAITVELGEPAAGYKVGRTVTLPTAWVTEEAPTVDAVNLAKYVTMHLSVDGYDGLCWPGTCGCGRDREGKWDLMPCDEPNVDCEPAWLCVCAETPECEHHGNCDTEGEGSGTCYRPGRKP